MSNSTQQLVVQPFTPPAPLPGCACTVCNPYHLPQFNQWRPYFERQQVSPFLKCRVVKFINGSQHELSDTDFQLIESGPGYIKDWRPDLAATHKGWVQLCLNLIKRMYSKHKESKVYFGRPVDTARVGDYLTVIRHPMDLGTIERELKSGRIDNPDQFISNVRLVYRNCFTYNPPQEMAVLIGKIMSEEFERSLDELRA